MDRRLLLPTLAVLGALAGSTGCVRSRCYDDQDCVAPRVCSATGRCVLQCSQDEECGAGFECANHRCRPHSVGPLSCPADMVSVAGTFCADRFEASRVDATDSSAGTDSSRALSVAGVLPWQVTDNATAARACAGSGKRLCSAQEWRVACRGPEDTAYSYGDDYDPLACNGIDAFGRSAFHLAPTGSFPRCTNEWGLFDINGNLWEHVAAGSDETVRGGAYNCGDSAALHRCDYVPGSWAPSARGFRCCLSPESVPATDAGSADAASSTPDAGAADDGGGGCLGGDSGPSAPDAEASSPDSGADPGPDAGPAPDTGLGACPADMAPVGRTCVDRFEASRRDATPTSGGTDESLATSRAGVLPWYVNPVNADALGRFGAACAAAGKRLCTADEWLDTCRGPAQTTYFFGNTWDPSVCNSVDTNCQQCCDALGESDCPTGENCGYSALLTSSYTPETCTITAPYGRTTCHVCFHVVPTGSFPNCTRDDLFDVNGNVWEVVPVDTTVDARGFQVRGGAFNCGAPSARFQCGFNAAWNDLYAGFRCCKDRP